MLVNPPFRAPLLDQRFAALKKSLVKTEHKEKVIESYERLCKAVKDEVSFIHRTGPSIVPEIQFEDVLKNGGSIHLFEGGDSKLNALS